MTDKTVLIVGASRGIGLGLAKEFAGRGYRVHGTRRSRSDELSASNATEHEVDVTDKASVAALASAIGEGTLDVLVMNAGVYGDGPQELADLTRDDLADIVTTNALGPVQAALALLPCMKEGGTIGMMSSKMGSIDDSSGGSNLYRVSKVAQNMLARSLHEKHASERGVTVVSLHPGWVQTDMGGPNALIDVDTSVAGLADRLEETREGHRFVAYDGEELPW